MYEGVLQLVPRYPHHLIKKLVVPQYSSCAMRRSAAALCNTGSDARFNTDEKITASRSVQVRVEHKGSKSPCSSRQQKSGMGDVAQNNSVNPPCRLCSLPTLKNAPGL